MNYGDLEEVYGGAFRKRVPIEEESKKDPLEKPLDSVMGPDKKGLNKAVQDVMRSANIDNSRNRESFYVYEEQPAPVRQQVRERFSQAQPTGGYSPEQADKINRILRLVEQNKTGYERPATQDILLYILTGVFFLFTFDTFVMLGKSMRGK